MQLTQGLHGFISLPTVSVVRVTFDPSRKKQQPYIFLKEQFTPKKKEKSLQSTYPHHADEKSGAVS